MESTGAKGKKIPNNKDELLEAAKATDAVRNRHVPEKGWTSTGEIRKWRASRQRPEKDRHSQDLTFQ